MKDQAQQLGADAQKALVYARKTGRVDNAAYRSLNRVDTLTASRALTQLEAAGLLHRSEQRRGPGVYYTLADFTGASNTTSKVTPKTQAELLTLLNLYSALCRMGYPLIQANTLS